MTKIFDWCVQFMIIVSPKLGLTYKEFNVLLFVIIHPTITLFLFFACCYYSYNYYKIKRQNNANYKP